MTFGCFSSDEHDFFLSISFYFLQVDVYDFEQLDKGETHALMFVIGYLLKKTICTKSFCEKCKDVFVVPGPCMPEHDFIDLREYKEGKLVYPSQLAFDIFSICEATFRGNRTNISVGKDIVEKMICEVDATIRERFPKAPICHMEQLLNRWFHIRMHFWATECNKVMQRKYHNDG